MRVGLPVVVLLAACASTPPVVVTLAHDRADEARTRDQLVRILAEHDVARFTYTRAILIDDESIPHSHPMLTLHARHLDDDDLLLSTFLHEQAHWWLEAHAGETAAAVTELRVMFPSLPVGFPEGAQSEQSNYEHLIVDHLEHVALRCSVGEERASRAFAFWATDHYRALYVIESAHEAEIETIAVRHGLAYTCGR